MSDLVVFGEDWSAHPSSTQHLVNELAHSRRVLWVNSIGMRRPRLNLSDFKRALRKLGAMMSRSNPAQAIRSAIDVLNPRAVPLPGNSIARSLNRLMLGSAIRKRLRDQHMDRPVLWLSLPTAVDVVGQLGERAVVYYCGDDFGALEGVDHGPVLKMEAELAERADLILVSHPALAAKFDSRKVHYVPHGVDISRFATAQPISAGTNRPVAGFVGAIDSRLDLSALAAAARALPEWEFRFYGPIKTDISELKRLDNVAFYGILAPSLVPGVVKGWSVALLPYVDCPMVRACNPLKLREYLATGTPVAAIDMPALDDFDSIVSRGDPSALATTILQARSSDSEAARRRRVECVLTQSWTTRAEHVAELIDAL